MKTKKASRSKKGTSIGAVVPPDMTETMSKLRQINKVLAERLGREPTIEEIVNEAAKKNAKG